LFSVACWSLKCVGISGAGHQSVFSLTEQALFRLTGQFDLPPDRFAIPVRPDLL
jgi:hypothetical protein